MDKNQPRKYFLSRETILKHNDLINAADAEGELVIRTPALLENDYTNLHNLEKRIYRKLEWKPFLFGNGDLLAFCGHMKYSSYYIAKSFRENEGALNVVNQYQITDNDNKKYVSRIFFSNKLDHVVLLFRKPTSPELCLTLLRFDKEGTKQNEAAFRKVASEYEVVVVKGDCGIWKVVCACMSPQWNYFCIFVHSQKYGSWLYIYNIDTVSNSSKLERSMDISTYFTSLYGMLVEMNRNATMVFIAHRRMFPRPQKSYALLYSLVDDQLLPVAWKEGSFGQFCRYLDHNLHGSLIFLMRRNENKECVVDILKYSTVGFGKLQEINMTKEFGIKEDVRYFTVHDSNETRMFLCYEQKIYVVEAFRRTLLYVIELCDGMHADQLCVNWNGQELFAVTHNHGMPSYETAVGVFYLPKKDELSLKHTAAIAVMAYCSASYLKTLNLPKIIKYLLRIV